MSIAIDLLRRELIVQEGNVKNTIAKITEIEVDLAKKKAYLGLVKDKARDLLTTIQLVEAVSG